MYSRHVGPRTRPPLSQRQRPARRHAAARRRSARSAAAASQSLECCPTSRTHQARACERERATPASTRVSSTIRSACGKRVMTGTARRVNNVSVSPQRAPHATLRSNLCSASRAIWIRCSRVCSRNRAIRPCSASACAAATSPSAASDRWQGADDQDLVSIDGDLGRRGEPLRRQPPDQPRLDVLAHFVPSVSCDYK